MKTNHCINCGRKIGNKSKRCIFCAPKFANYPSRKGKNNSQFKDGRYLRKYCCLDCGNEITIGGGVYGSGLCSSCSAKERLKDPRNHPMFGNPRKDLQIKFSGKGNPRFGHKVSKNTRIKMSKKRKGKNNPMYGKHHTEKTKQKMRNAIIIRFKKGKYNIKPNKPEKALNALLNKLLPKEYKYVGNFKFWIESFNPDFININGQKKIIEMYGDYWHNRKDAKKRDKRRLIAYKQYGYKTLIIWEHELKDLEKVKSLIIDFTKNRGNVWNRIRKNKQRN